MRKAIILLLVASMLSLTSCSNKSVEANTSTAESNTSSAVSADVSSVESDNVYRENVSSEDSVSTVDSKKSAETKKKATSSEKNKYGSKAEHIKACFNANMSHYEVSPEKSTIKNNPAIVDTVKNYKTISDEAIESTATMDKKELKDHKKNIEYYLKNSIIYAKKKDWEKEYKNNEQIGNFAYFGKVDEYNVFYMYLGSGSLERSSSFNRLAGYQFLALPVVRNYFSGNYKKDKYMNYNTNIKNVLKYSGIVLEKSGKYYTMEDLYIDNVISADTVGKIYNALPKTLQMGKFDYYKDVYDMRGFKLYQNSNLFYNCIDEKDYKADFISYYDKDGKFHVVYADD